MQVIKRDDTVAVLWGEDKGKTGKVIKVYPRNNTALVQGINYVWKHVRRTQAQPRGGRIQKEQPIHISKLMLVCEKCNRPVKVVVKTTPENRKERFCKKCNQPIGAS